MKECLQWCNFSHYKTSDRVESMSFLPDTKTYATCLSLLDFQNVKRALSSLDSFFIYSLDITSFALWSHFILFITPHNRSSFVTFEPVSFGETSETCQKNSAAFLLQADYFCEFGHLQKEIWGQNINGKCRKK